MSGSTLDPGWAMLSLSLARVNRQANLYLSRQLQDSPLGMGQYPLFMLIGDHPGILQDEAAKRLMLDKANITRATQKLLEVSLIGRVGDAKDGRKKRLAHSAEGKKLFTRAKKILLAWEEKLSSALSEREKREVVQSLRKISEGLELEGK